MLIITGLVMRALCMCVCMYVCVCYFPMHSGPSFGHSFMIIIFYLLFAKKAGYLNFRALIGELVFHHQPVVAAAVVMGSICCGKEG